MDALQPPETSPSGLGPTTPTPKNPACDHCREKKIRCSRDRPICAHCSSSRTTCVYSEPFKRPTDAVPGSRNAHRFEELNSRLDRIEAAIASLTDLVLRQHGPPDRERESDPPEEGTSSVEEIPVRRRRVLAASSSAPMLPAVPAQVQFVTDAQGTSQYLGSSSILSITSEAQKLAEEQLISADLLSRRLLDNHGNRSGLDNLLHSSSETLASAIPSYGHSLIRSSAALVKPHIPWKAEALEMAEDFFKSVYYWFPLLDRASFMKDLDRMYEHPETMTKDGAWMACFHNVILFGLYGKRMNYSGEERMSVDQQKTQTSFYNAWSALDDLEVFMTPRLRNVQALFTMAMCAIELSRPALCWGLLSQAARSAQALGLHRRGKPQSSASTAQVEERKNLFWCIYILDKYMSLIFGRSASLPEFDCDCELPVDDGSNPFFAHFMAEIALARIQSSIYIRLYSAQAAAQSLHDLEVAILELDREVDAWWTEYGDMTDYFKTTAGTRAFSSVDFYKHIQLKYGYYSSVTLINRMTRPGMSIHQQSSQKALEGARAAIKMVVEVVQTTKDIANTGLLLWLFNCHPFTSFFLLFSSIIRNPAHKSSTETDLPLMQALVAYFTTMQERDYESAARLRSVASAFTNVAITFLRNYRRHTTTGDDGGGGARKRHRPLDHDDDLPDLYPPASSVVRKPAFTGIIATTTAANARAPTTPPEATDLQTAAAFLRWQGTTTQEAVESSAAQGLADIEMLIAEPLGFQMRMELGGPLDFDWFGWEEAQSLGDEL